MYMDIDLYVIDISTHKCWSPLFQPHLKILSLLTSFQDGKGSALIFENKDPENYWLEGLSPTPRQLMEQNPPGKHFPTRPGGQGGDGSRQHGFTTGKSCLSSPRAFLDETAGVVEEWSAGCACSLHFSTAFHSISHNSLPDKSMKHSLDRQG